jgi:hypothetical protein
VATPTAQQLEIALEAAERMRQRDLDPHFLAHSLLYLWERNRHFEQLLVHADRYLRFGMDEGELGALRQLVQRLREQPDAPRHGLDVADLL